MPSRLKGAAAYSAALTGATLSAVSIFVIRVPDSLPARLGVWRLGEPYRLPPTFMLGVGLFLLALPLLSLHRLRFPGREGGQPAGAPSILSHGSLRWLAAGVAFLTLLAILEHRFHRPSLAFLPWLGLLAWGAFHLRRLDRARDVSTSFGLSWGEGLGLAGAAALASIYWLRDAASWKYAMIGDEWQFFEAARMFAATPFWQWDVFKAAGVFGDIPIAVSIIQGLFVKTFGASLLGWKASGTAMLLLALPFLYRWIREEVGRFGASLAVGVYVTSYLVATWARIGKPIAFFAPLLAAAVCLLTLSRRGSLLFAFLAGVAGGAAWFFFSLSAIAAAAFLGVTLGAGLVFGRRRFDVERAAAAFAGWLAGAAPILVQFDYVTHLFTKNLTEPGLHSVWANTVHAAVGFASFSAGEQFFSGQIWDPISALLVLLGISACARTRRTSPLLLCGISVFSVGALAYYAYPPMTRMLMMSLPWAALAGVGAAWLRSALPLGGGAALYAGGAAMVALLAFNQMALIDDSNRLVNQTMWVARFIQDHPGMGRLLYVTPREGDTYFDNQALAAYSPSARAVSDIEAAEAVREETEAAGGSGLVVVIGPSVALAGETAATLIDHRIPTYEAQYGCAANLPSEPPRLTALQIRRLVPEPAPPIRYEVVSWSQGWGRLTAGRACTGGPMHLGDRLYAQGLGTHAPSRVEISFRPDFETLSGLCGIDGGPGGAWRGVFRILDGERILFESPLRTGDHRPMAFSVPVRGLSRLVLTFGDGGGEKSGGAADWANLELR
ncbi:MAG: NPCBM/NEW2 domain-containing protein [Thermoanaerobaculia bacterium]